MVKTQGRTRSCSTDHTFMVRHSKSILINCAIRTIGRTSERPSHSTARTPSLQPHCFAGAKRLMDVVGDAVDAQRLKLDGAFNDRELQHAVENS